MSILQALSATGLLIFAGGIGYGLGWLEKKYNNEMERRFK